MPRTAELTRSTSETQIALRLDLDGTGVATVSTGVGFLDHMLTALARHSLIDLEIEAKGDKRTARLIDTGRPCFTISGRGRTAAFLRN